MKLLLYNAVHYLRKNSNNVFGPLQTFNLDKLHLFNKRTPSDFRQIKWPCEQAFFFCHSAA